MSYLKELKILEAIMDFEYYNELLINGQYESEEEMAILEYIRDELYYEALNELMYEEYQKEMQL